jgi:Ca-activated chloride channel family protein
MTPDLLLDYEFAVTSNEYVVRVLLKLQGNVPDQQDRSPLNLSLVLDRSGSMAGEKIAAAKDAARHLVRRLHTMDMVSIVAYDTDVVTVAPPTTGSEQTLADRIAALHPGSATNLSGGWFRGRELVAANRKENAVNRILLLTDGLANNGITDPHALAGLCASARENGITTTTIGFGEDYDEHLLRAMADAGGGHTYYIEQPDQAPGIFAEEIEGLLGLSAQNVAVEIRPAAAAKLTVVHHDFPKQELADGLRLEVGDLYAREPRRILVEFVVPDALTAEEREIGEIRVNAVVLSAGGEVEQQELRIPIRASLDRAGSRDPEITREVLLVAAARAREAALEAQRRGEFEAGRRHLRAIAEQLNTHCDPADAEVQEEVRDLQAMAERYEAHAVSPADLKYMYNRAFNVHRGKAGATRRISRDRSAGRPGVIDYVHGDVTRPAGNGRKIIAHAVDDAGMWGHGVAQAISARWGEPEARYHAWRRGEIQEPESFALGAVQVTRVAPDLWVATLVANSGQHVVQGTPQLRMEALERAMGSLAEFAAQHAASVHMGFIGCAAAGGEWPQISRVVEEALCRRGLAVIVYEL